MAAKRGSKAPREVFLQWRSPTVATFILSLRSRLDGGGPVRDVLGGHWPMGSDAPVRVAPARHIGEVLLPREQRAPAEALVGGWWLARFTLEQSAQGEHDARRNAGTLARIDEAEECQMVEQDPPVGTEPGQEAAPVELPVAGPDQVRDVRAVVALALHHECLRPDHLLGRAQAHGHAEHGRGHGVSEPSPVDVGDTVARAVDDVDVVALEMRLPQPVRKGQIRLESAGRQRSQQREGVAPADEYVEVLRAPHALRIVPQRITSTHQERDARSRHLDERVPVAPASLQGVAIRAPSRGPVRSKQTRGRHEQDPPAGHGRNFNAAPVEGPGLAISWKDYRGREKWEFFDEHPRV